MALITPRNLPANIVGASQLDLAANFAFTGTVTGAGLSGKILNTYATNQWNGNINSSSYIDLTNNSITLTPESNTSKFFITLHSSGTQTNGASNGGLRVLRDSTELGGTGCYGNPGGIRSIMPMPFVWMDSPATTSQIVYKVQWQKRNGGGLGTADFGQTGRMVIMEISS